MAANWFICLFFGILIILILVEGYEGMRAILDQLDQMETRDKDDIEDWVTRTAEWVSAPLKVRNPEEIKEMVKGVMVAYELPATRALLNWRLPG